MVCVSPTRSNSRSCSARSSFTCRWGVVELISSRKMVPVWAASKRPVRFSMAPVNAPRTWPKSSLSKQAFGEGAAVDADERPVAALAQFVDGVRDEFLARARFAQQQHRRAAPRDLPRDAEDFLHRGAGTDNARQRLDRRFIAGQIAEGLAHC